MNQNCDLLRETLNNLVLDEELLSANIISIYIYGSFVTDELTAKSDIDSYIIVKDVNPELLNKIKELKAEVEKKLEREFFVNISQQTDFSPENFINNSFTHRERPYYFLFELKYNFQLFYGRNFVKEINFPEMMEGRVKEECLRLLKNLQYLNNKLIVNSETKLYPKDAACKNILFAAKIFQIFNEYRFNNYLESVNYMASCLNSQVPLLAYRLNKQPELLSVPEEISVSDSIIFYKVAIKYMTQSLSNSR
ncbi:MAG: nucleotidyltransferase domain-containing protein [Patescibacteria group bacterium]|jgi:predicted nucleotidyltransferase